MTLRDPMRSALYEKLVVANAKFFCTLERAARSNRLMHSNPPSNLVIKTESSGLWSIPDHQLVLDARRRGATTEPYGAIRCKEERSKATVPFDFAQGREPVERQMMP